ncbi:MAG TPA: hypothetical protein VKU19_16170 [Bryobacteraceae bacterium]|nr:hypothetical protein [Bryobacteraceae bacterium]
MNTSAFVLMAATAVCVHAQEADFGISVPVTVSGGGLSTRRLQVTDPGESTLSGGFRVLLYPTLKLGSHWFGYAAVQSRLEPYFYYDAFQPRHQLRTDVLQAFAGYSWHIGQTAMVVKAGKLSSAFGAFPLRYDDVQNPLLDQPLSYVTAIPLRADQIACGTRDLLRQFYGSVGESCGGAAGRGPGLTPVTLYGLPGGQVEVSSRGLDGRLQLTVGSPSNSQPWSLARQYLQWAAGAGYTIRHDLRVGVSGFRGPYLSPSVSALLPSGTIARDFPASGLGLDVQWARGRWTLSGEMQRFEFRLPNFVVSPSVRSSYIEAKSMLTPRLFLAGRAGRLRAGRVADSQNITAAEWAPSLTGIEMSAGSWVNRHVLVKASYGILHSEGDSSTRFNVLGIQVVTTLHALNQAFR